MENRSIKFRAWDKENKEWYNSAWMRDGIFDPTDSSNGFLDSHILLQFTGLKDKNGKEIYEGDLMKIEGDFITIEWMGTIYGQGFVMHHKERGNRSGEWGKGEIIGNIYENPELIKND